MTEIDTTEFTQLNILKESADDPNELEEWIKCFKKRSNSKMWSKFIELLDNFVKRDDYPSIVVKGSWRHYP